MVYRHTGEGRYAEKVLEPVTRRTVSDQIRDAFRRLGESYWAAVDQGLEREVLQAWLGGAEADLGRDDTRLSELREAFTAVRALGFTPEMICDRLAQQLYRGHGRSLSLRDLL